MTRRYDIDATWEHPDPRMADAHVTLRERTLSVLRNVWPDLNPDDLDRAGATTYPTSTGGVWTIRNLTPEPPQGSLDLWATP